MDTTSTNLLSKYDLARHLDGCVKNEEEIAGTKTTAYQQDPTEQAIPGKAISLLCEARHQLSKKIQTVLGRARWRRASVRRRGGRNHRWSEQLHRHTAFQAELCTLNVDVGALKYRRAKTGRTVVRPAHRTERPSVLQGAFAFFVDAEMPSYPGTHRVAHTTTVTTLLGMESPRSVYRESGIPTWFSSLRSSGFLRQPIVSRFAV